MNRGFNYYFREGVSSSAKTIYRNKNFIKSVLWLFLEFLGLATVIFYPLICLAKVRQGENVRLKNKLDISAAFKDSGSPYSVWTLVLTFCVQALMFLAGVLAIAVITVLLGALGYAVSAFTTGVDKEVVIGCFMIPGGVILIVYTLLAALIFAPAPYMVASNPQAGVAEILSACFNTMKCSGKMTLFLNLFIPALIIDIYLVFAGGVGYLIYFFLSAEQFYILVMILWNIIAIIGLALVAPLFVFATRCANQHLFTDIAVDPAAASGNINGINIISCRGEKYGSSVIEKNLVSLFDETEAEGVKLTEGVRTEARRMLAMEEFAAEANLSEAYMTKGKKKKKNKSAAAEEEEALPTVTDVLTGEAPAGVEKVKVPTVDVTETAVEPSVEKIIKDAESRAEKEEQPEEPKVETAEKADKPEKPNVEENNVVLNAVKEPTAKAEERGAPAPEAEKEEDDGLDEPAVEAAMDDDGFDEPAEETKPEEAKLEEVKSESENKGE